jgi:hypothetical protein
VVADDHDAAESGSSSTCGRLASSRPASCSTRRPITRRASTKDGPGSWDADNGRRGARPSRPWPGRRRAAATGCRPGAASRQRAQRQPTLPDGLRGVAQGLGDVGGG